MAISQFLNLDTDATLSNNSDTTVSSQKAVKTYVDTKQDIITDLDTIRAGAALGATSIQHLYAHNLNFGISGDKTVVCMMILTQSDTSFTVNTLFDFIYNNMPDSSKGIMANGTVKISSIDHKTIGMISRGSNNTSITLYPIMATGGYDNTVTVNASAITEFNDTVYEIL